MINTDSVKLVTIDEAIEHVAWLLKDDEKEVVREKILKTINSRNIFWHYTYFSFYYGRPVIDSTNVHPSKMDNRHFLRLTFSSGHDYSWHKNFVQGTVETLQYDEISINVGDSIKKNDGGTFSLPNSKYCHLRPPYKIISIEGDKLHVSFTYQYYKLHEFKETWSLSETIKGIYRREFDLIK